MAEEIAEPTVLTEAPALDSARQLDAAPANEEIANLAYSFWEARGGIGGSAEEDWLAAEAELRRKRTGFNA